MNEESTINRQVGMFHMRQSLKLTTIMGNESCDTIIALKKDFDVITIFAC